MGRLRIVAGTLGGRRLRAPAGTSVRPTSERVREALFSILGDRVVGARVLDAYAGSGALGCEALSRGAACAVFVESSPAVAAVLRANVAELGLTGRARIVRRPVLAFLAGTPEVPWDLVLADPPYGSEEPARLLGMLAGGAVLHEDGWVVLERSHRSEPPGGAGRLVRTRTERYGDTSLDFFRFSGHPARPGEPGVRRDGCG